MASEGMSLKGLNAALNRVQRQFESVNTQLEELDEAAQSLSERLEQHSQVLEHQTHLDQMWLCLLEDRFTTVEKNLFFTYAVDTLQRCHSLVLEKLPDLVPTLPTVASILSRKSKSRRVHTAWESVLGALGLNHSDINALCAFCVTQGCQAEYYTPAKRQRNATGVEPLIRKVVNSDVLKNSLLKAVRVVDAEKAGSIVSNTREEPKPTLSIREQFGNKILGK
ncbi:single-pass membrane and coiled-coil domain-containing protein 1 [Arapaima gigas]